MKKQFASLLAVLFVLSALAGCSSNPRQDYAVTNDTFIATVQTLIMARDTGEFTAEEWEEEVLPQINLGNQLLRDYDAATRAGLEGDDLLLRVQQVLVILQPYLNRIQSE